MDETMFCRYLGHAKTSPSIGDVLTLDRARKENYSQS